MARGYKLWAIGDPIFGSSPMLHVGIAGVAKSPSQEVPRLVANEFICARLAQALLLPVPPGFLIQNDDETWFVSLNFNLSGEDLPPACPSRIAKDMPDLATGILMFDIWVANRDRHRRNLVFDAETERLQIFDHGSALFVGGADHMENLRLGELQIGALDHCLIPCLQENTYFAKWIDRITALPDWFMRGIFDECMDAGLITTEMARAGSDFLLNRRSRLQDILNANRARFTAMQWGLLASTHDSEA